MDKTESTMAQQLADAVRNFQIQQTGRAPTKVTVVMSEDTLVVALHEALSPAEQALAKSPEGAANLREFHQQLFRNSVSSLRKDIERIGTTVQVFLLADSVPFKIGAQSEVAAPAA
jgi:uncharacterized protein YbcI